MVSAFASVKRIIACLLDILTKIFCKKKHRRKLSVDAPLVTIHVQSQDTEPEITNWDAWEDNQLKLANSKPSTIEEHIQLYRQQNAYKEDPDLIEQRRDYFQDMTPRITEQTRIIIQKNEVNHEVTSSSKLKYDEFAINGNELGTWDDRDAGANWDIDDTQDMDRILKEKRKQDRERRIHEQMKKRAEKERQKTHFASKVT